MWGATEMECSTFQAPPTPHPLTTQDQTWQWSAGMDMILQKAIRRGMLVGEGGGAALSPTWSAFSAHIDAIKAVIPPPLKATPMEAAMATIAPACEATKHRLPQGYNEDARRSKEINGVARRWLQ